MSRMLNLGTVADVRGSRLRESGEPTQSLNSSEPQANQAFLFNKEARHDD